MPKTWLIILIHQFLFQGMFVAKNIALGRKTGQRIRGGNPEVRRAILFFTVFICLALTIGLFDRPPGFVPLLNPALAALLGGAMLALNLGLAAAALLDLRESWRVGIVDGQETDLVTSGVYGVTRNPYFAAYLLMFAAYTTLLQNLILLGLSLVGVYLVNRMVVREESFLLARHGDAYARYQRRVPRYLFRFR